MAIDAGHGDSHSGKSRALSRLAKHLWETQHKKTRVYFGDGGADTYDEDGGVTEGWIQMMDFSFRDYPETVLKLMTDFYFLKDPKDQNSKLVKPDLAKFYDEFGLNIYEGGTVIGNWLLSDVPGGLAWHAAESTGFGGVKDEDGVLSYKDNFKGADGIDAYLEQGFNSPKHYMIAQRKIVNAIRSSKKFPGLTFWTFHTTEGADKTQGGEAGQYGKVSGKKVMGPDAGGRALVSTLSKEFGNMFHFDLATTIQKNKDETTAKQISVVEKEFRLYTRRHYDPDQNVLIEYIAGTRTAGLKDHYTSVTPGDSLLQVYQEMARLRRERNAKPA